MNEPVYTYRKGEGWVIQTVPDCPHVFFEHSGKKWVLECRQPVEGEHYLFGYGSEQGYLEAVARALKEANKIPSLYYQWPSEAHPPQFIVYREV